MTQTTVTNSLNYGRVPNHSILFSSLCVCPESHTLQVSKSLCIHPIHYKGCIHTIKNVSLYLIHSGRVPNHTCPIHIHHVRFQMTQHFHSTVVLDLPHTPSSVYCELVPNHTPYSLYRLHEPFQYSCYFRHAL